MADRTAADTGPALVAEQPREAILQLRLPSEIQVAGGARSELARSARAHGVTRALVISDPYLVENGPVTDLMQDLVAAGLDPVVYGEVQPDPTVRNVSDALDRLREHGADGLIAIGGGSSIDTAKAVAVMAENEGSVTDYVGYHQIEQAGLPIVALPTTAGTGSEVTRVTVVTDSSTHAKLMLLSDHLLCSAALVDHELSHTCPPDLTAHVGVDSLTHAIEAYVSRAASPVTDAWAAEAMRLIGTSLTVAVDEPGNAAARSAMALGATLAGMAFSNASVALVHGMSRPLGAYFGLPHGLSNAVLLPEVTRYSLSGARERYGCIARVLGFAGPSLPSGETADALVEGLTELNRRLGVTGLARLGCERARLDDVKWDMAEAAIESGSPAFNPRVPTAAEIVAIYDAAF